MQRNLITGIGALVIGAGYLAIAFQLRASALADAVGPAGLPRIFGFVMVALGAILCVQSMVAARTGARTPRVAVVRGPDGAVEAEPKDDAEGLAFRGLAKAGGLLAIAIGYLLIIKTVGYIVAVGALIIAAALYGGAKATWQLVAIGVGGAVVFWILFVEILGIPLPAGVLSSFL